jgi:hypothetical protein
VTRRQIVPAAAAVAAVILAAVAHTLMNPPPSGALVDAAVLAAVAVCAYTAAANGLHNGEIRKAERLEREAADRRRAALADAADYVITGRSDGPDGQRPHPSDSPSVTPAAVARYAATMGVTGVTLDEAAAALAARLAHRGYAPRP